MNDDKRVRSDVELDRMLAGGKLSGPEMDALWARIAPRVTTRKPLWKRALRSMWVWMPLAAAAVLLLVVGRRDDGFTERGGGGAQLQATCGSPSSPCKAGDPVHLRFANLSAGVLYVAHVPADGKPVLVAGPVTTEGGTLALPVKMVPDASDVENGITLAWWVADRAIAVDEILRTAPQGTLHITVVSR